MAHVDLIAVPYDSGTYGERMGAGPLHFLERGVDARLRAAGHEVETSVVGARAGFHAEIATSFHVYQTVSLSVLRAVEHGRFPLILAGNCGSAIGAVSGVARTVPARPLGLPGPHPSARRIVRDVESDTALGVIWFDAHGDLNTPETTRSGFLDGMALATLTGRCWHTLAAGVPNFQPVPDERVVLVGARDLDPDERTLLEESAITWVPATRVRDEGMSAALVPALDALRQRVSRVYVHIDLDVHDPAEAPANEFASPHGLSASAVSDAVTLIAERFRISVAALTAYDPRCDPGGKTMEAGVELMRLLAGSGGG